MTAPLVRDCNLTRSSMLNLGEQRDIKGSNKCIYDKLAFDIYIFLLLYCTAAGKDPIGI